ncbi:MAG TPA: hypothetical protein VHE55_12590 [Fimbriimonadaceae bacterium]|nr:hypothetical protein [Fimbriimonadaceae bacterium]
MDSEDICKKTRLGIIEQLKRLVKFILAFVVAALVFVSSILIAMSVDRRHRADTMREVGSSYSPPELDGIGGGIIGFPVAVYVGLALWRGMRRSD